MKRYLRLDMEYEFSGNELRMPSFEIKDILVANTNVNILFSRDTPFKEDLDKPVYKRIV